MCVRRSSSLISARWGGRNEARVRELFAGGEHVDDEYDDDDEDVNLSGRDDGE